MDKKNEKLNVEVFDYSTIPKFMQEHGRFCLWKLVMKPGKTKPDKIPYRINGKRADATNPQHYSSFEETVETFAGGGYAGIGIGCFEPPRLVDVDDCVVNGKLDSRGQDVVDTLDSYTELSPSGNGIHIFILADGFAYDSERYYINNRNTNVEVYAPDVTHEAIIDQETFDIVQRIRDGRRRRTPMGEMPILSGMLYCADCGAKLYQVRAKGWTHEQEHFVCATYRKVKGGCSSHQIHNVQVEEILLKELHRITAYAREHEREFIELVTKQTEKDLNRQLRDSHKELEQAKSRIAKLDTIVQRLYEDNLDGKISDERFARMSATYDAEQKELEHRQIELQEFIDKSKEQTLNVDSFLKVVRKYTDITELTAEIMRSFVERIDVYKPEKVPGTRTKKQTICIHWNFIGAIDIPAEHEKTA